MASAQEKLDRTVLPIAEPKRPPPITELDARKAKAPPLFEVKAPAGAPNVIVILLDNFGYAGSRTFGGVMNTPTRRPRPCSSSSSISMRSVGRTPR